MSNLLDQRLTEWGLWFMENRTRVPPENIRKRQDFMDKAIQGLIECMAIAVKDIQELERRDPRKQLWLPKTVDVSGDLRKFG